MGRTQKRATVKPGRLAFREHRVSPRTKKKRHQQVSPGRRLFQVSKRETLRTAKRVSFGAELKKELRSGTLMSQAVASAGVRTGVKSKDRVRYVKRLEEYIKPAKLSWKNLEVRALIGNAEGQGKPSEWDARSEAAFKQYLLSRPKMGGSDKQWPSTNVLASDTALQAKLGVPSQCSKQYQRKATELGLRFVSRTLRSFLTRGMKKRRHSYGKKYGAKTKAWWRGTAWQDEGHIDRWQVGPRMVWMTEEQAQTRKETRKVVKGRGGAKLNFSVLFGYKRKAPLFMYETNFNGELSIKMIKKQWIPFFKANPHIKRLVTDGDKSHPGNGDTQSKLVRELWNKTKCLSRLELLGAENIWDNETGELRTNAKKRGYMTLDKRRNRRAVKGATDKGAYWIANSPDMNSAEHAVAGIVDKTHIPEGYYEMEKLKNLTKRTWSSYDQDSLDTSIESMPKRCKALVTRKGDYLLKGEDF